MDNNQYALLSILLGLLGGALLLGGVVLFGVLAYAIIGAIIHAL